MNGPEIAWNLAALFYADQAEGLTSVAGRRRLWSDAQGPCCHWGERSGRGMRRRWFVIDTQIVFCNDDTADAERGEEFRRVQVLYFGERIWRAGRSRERI